MDCTLETEIGKGAYGQVWKGVCDGETVAIKVFDKLKDWQSEYFNLKQIKGVCEPYALCLLGQYVRDGKGYVVTNLIEGPTFLRLIRSVPLEKRQATSTPMTDLVKGLALIHSAGVVHLDIKETNIMKDKYFRYIDFGYGCRKGDRDCIYTGSEYSAAPTKDLEKPYSWEEGMSFDVWSLGIMLLRWYSMVWDFKEFQDGFFPSYSSWPREKLDYVIKTIPNTGIRSIVGIFLVEDFEQRNINFEFAQKLLSHSENIAKETSSDVLLVADALVAQLMSRDVDNVMPTVARIMSLTE